MRIVISAFPDLTPALPDGDHILPALRPAQVELIDRLEIVGGLGIELTGQVFEKILDRWGSHDRSGG
jgi:hypothetical protein